MKIFFCLSVAIVALFFAGINAFSFPSNRNWLSPASFPSSASSLKSNRLQKIATVKMSSDLTGESLVADIYGGASSPTTGKVLEINKLVEFEKIVTSANQKKQLMIVDFSATWCGPCKMIAPHYKQIAEMKEYANMIFVKVQLTLFIVLCLCLLYHFHCFPCLDSSFCFLSFI
jgi:thiol-disulfide isomerase/thioredoxin